MYLLDTNVLSETRKAQANPNVMQWLAAQGSEGLFISVMSLGEIQRGISKQRIFNPDFAAELQIWLDALQTRFAKQILPVTPNIARRWGEMSQVLGNKSVDLIITATALEYGLCVVTRNITDFEVTSVKTLNVF